jgi:hypothetical protein
VAKALGTDQVVLVLHPECSHRYTDGSWEQHPHAGSPIMVYPYGGVAAHAERFDKAKDGPYGVLMPVALMPKGQP